MIKQQNPSKELLTNTNIPAEFKNSMYSDYNAEIGDPKIIKVLREWEPTVKRPSLLFYGNPGLAKTMLASATLNEYHALCKVPAKAEGSTRLRMKQERSPVYFVQLAEWISLQHRSFQLNDRYRRGDVDVSECVEIDNLIQDIYHRVEILVIDDVGKEHRTQTEFTEDSVDFLLRTRHNHGLSTVFTTNIPLSRWSGKYAKSMESFIRRTCVMLEFR